ncbi:CLUMA_CG006211, isoform A [Clunio marinus]|uniref:CLUMA_CG006211, isoform A n=1 Tax=Clunio marinus TaxID=568069 RepID=A0A1J1HXD7_9DIPT|nr:CLUMA_CG006211, isoform A [Clunio marinus]
MEESCSALKHHLLRKWAVPKGRNFMKIETINLPQHQSLQHNSMFICFSTSANFLQRTIHAMSGMLNKDKTPESSIRAMNFSCESFSTLKVLRNA